MFICLHIAKCGVMHQTAYIQHVPISIVFHLLLPDTLHQILLLFSLEFRHLSLQFVPDIHTCTLKVQVEKVLESRLQRIWPGSRSSTGSRWAQWPGTLSTQLYAVQYWWMCIFPFTLLSWLEICFILIKLWNLMLFFVISKFLIIYR